MKPHILFGVVAILIVLATGTLTLGGIVFSGQPLSGVTDLVLRILAAFFCVGATMGLSVFLYRKFLG